MESKQLLNHVTMLIETLNFTKLGVKDMSPVSLFPYGIRVL